MGSCSHSTLEATGCNVAVACCCQSRCVSKACLHYTIIMSLCLFVVLWCAIVDSEGCSSSCSQRMLFHIVSSQVRQGQFTGEAPAPPLQPQYVLAAACPSWSLHNARSRCGATPVSCCACQPLLAVTPAPCMVVAGSRQCCSSSAGAPAMLWWSPWCIGECCCINNLGWQPRLLRLQV